MTAATVRSLLFVPGHKGGWLRRAVDCGADGVILDLEDAVAAGGKAAARREVAAALAGWDRVAGTGRPVLRLVRVNAWGTGHLLADLDAVVGPNLDGVCLPKVGGAGEVGALALVLDELEAARGLPPGGLEIFPVAETAAGMLDVAAICASPRVRRISGVSHSVPGGDYYRALGARWDPSGVEACLTGAMAVLAGRAAGLESILCGPSSAVGDLDHLRAVLERGRTLGADGALCIHPDHVAVAHEVFAPTEEEIAAARAVVAVLGGGGDGDAAVVVDGRMVDRAHLRSSEELLRRASAGGGFLDAAG